MERLRELDVVCGQDICDFLRNVRLATLFHKDKIKTVREMAQKAGVPQERFSSYIWLQAYTRELACSCDDIPAPEDVAQQFGIDWLDFQKYFLDRAEAFRDESVVEDNDFRWARQQGLFLYPWEEKEDILADLQEDAGLMGD